MRITITQRPQQVTIKRDCFTHSARWKQRGGGDATLFDVVGDENLCRAALTAWSGPNVFELTDDELAERGGGWWP